MTGKMIGKNIGKKVDSISRPIGPHAPAPGIIEPTFPF
jgi:hypothetical protein